MVNKYQRSIFAKTDQDNNSFFIQTEIILKRKNIVGLYQEYTMNIQRVFE